MFSLLLHKEWMWFSTCCHYSFSNNNSCCFPCVLTAHLISSGWIPLRMLSLLFTKQQMWFFTCCHCSISKNNGCYFPCVVTAHLISSRWISICCHCCFTKQWMWFSTCCHYPLSKKQIWFSVCFHSTLNKQRRVFLCFHCCVLSGISGFPHVVTALFQTSMDAVFLVLSRHIH